MVKGDATASTIAADAADERLISSQGLAGAALVGTDGMFGIKAIVAEQGAEGQAGKTGAHFPDEFSSRVTTRKKTCHQSSSFLTSRYKEIRWYS